MAPELVRPAEPDDIAALSAIYNHYIETTPITFDLEPFTVDERRRSWFEHYASTGRHRLLVLDIDGEVLGYCCSSTFRPKGAYQTSVETSIYLAPTITGRGYGRRLYAELFEALHHEDVNRAYAGITLPNPASVVLHRRFGFESVGVYTQVGRKFDKYWDVEWFEKPLGGSATPRERGCP